jgi:hypothetical protein
MKMPVGLVLKRVAIGIAVILFLYLLFLVWALWKGDMM